MDNIKLAPLGIRMKDELKAYLRNRAVENHRSLNAEIVVRLEQSRTNELARVGPGTSIN
ncbi:Arc family DNA-binding protein [Glaciimonas sp. PAMC28666]|uniref:Arc family DNA-binding protein n=1 Tax=Glaciimonas sp. PAMC28666 TaxID=2807626 RepID=UPI00196309CC|nr:Arc family DNA-binding protein [Glaciimonas sp. PAMC28666]